ncbi:hypothetical protein RISK_000303 [Rhodopirellula islandica]|uniref:Tetratricopeptide repeat protein n=1 Tax=Rhodopirellula islandica TaxID=595434 RepID=A0A0J1BM70_RHOIS|nr:hypothetical protein [Rhodopirellula islandica]KLU07626.1 hypothetical protein RISK_000303 [Rhodopirellula islandica]
MTAVPTNEGSESATVSTRRQQLEHHLKTCPTDREGYLELATIYREEHRPLQAAKVLRQAHELFPDDMSMLWELEEAQLARSVQQLVEVRDLATRLGNSSADHELDRATTDWANCRLKVCRARLARDPSLTYLHMVLGEALYDLERYEEAMEELEPLVDSETHSPGAYLLMGRCQLLLSQDMAAMKSLRQASIRRAVVGPAKTRSAALRLLIDLAERHGLHASLQFYQQSLQAIS